MPAFAPVDNLVGDGASAAAGEDVALATVAVLVAILEVGVELDGELLRLDADVDVKVCAAEEGVRVDDVVVVPVVARKKVNSVSPQ